jgi:cbb3-type cytochrome oxidase maturation protein
VTILISVNLVSFCIFVARMGVVFLMMMASVSLALVFLILFIIGAKKGQFDEDESPAIRMLKDNKLKEE